MMQKWMLVLALVVAASAGASVSAQELVGSDLPSLLRFARENNPEFAAMRAEAEAAEQRIQPAGAFPDPVGRIELQDITNAEMGGRTSLLPNEVGST